jgi:hypothetical protein
MIARVVAVMVSVLVAPGAWQAPAGAVNASAVAAARRSPLVQGALAAVAREAGAIADTHLRQIMVDAIGNADTCIAHRRGLDEAAKRVIVQRLIDEKLIAGQTAEQAVAGVFPPVRDEGSACPKLPQAFGVAPGGNGSHHDYPGGLAVHESYNLAGALNLAKENRDIYGVAPNLDVIRAAVIWHDWAKTIVHQWNADGTITAEATIAETGAHHILGVAEAIARHCPADEVIAQASAHNAPGRGADDKIAKWIEAAAIIARQDPVAAGLLTHDAGGYHLRSNRPPAAQATDDPFTASIEAVIVNVADMNFYSVSASAELETLLPALAPGFGYSTQDMTVFRNRFRNPILSYDSADRLAGIYRHGGLDALRTELARLHSLGVFKVSR